MAVSKSVISPTPPLSILFFLSQPISIVFYNKLKSFVFFPFCCHIGGLLLFVCQSYIRVLCLSSQQRCLCHFRFHSLCVLFFCLSFSLSYYFPSPRLFCSSSLFELFISDHLASLLFLLILFFSLFDVVMNDHLQSLSIAVAGSTKIKRNYVGMKT